MQGPNAKSGFVSDVVRFQSVPETEQKAPVGFRNPIDHQDDIDDGSDHSDTEAVLSSIESRPTMITIATGCDDEDGKVGDTMLCTVVQKNSTVTYVLILEKRLAIPTTNAGKTRPTRRRA